MKTQATEDWRDFTGSLWLSIPRKEACALHMIGMRRVRPDGDSCVSRDLAGKAFPRDLAGKAFPRDLAGKAFLRDTRETFYSTSLSNLIHTFCANTIYTHITHKC